MAPRLKDRAFSLSIGLHLESTIIDLSFKNPYLVLVELKEQEESIARAKFTKSKDWCCRKYMLAFKRPADRGSDEWQCRFFIDVDRNSLWTGLGLDANWDLKEAGEALNQSLQRQLLGTSITLEQLEAQEMFVWSRIKYLEAVAKYSLAQFQLKVVEGGVR